MSLFGDWSANASHGGDASGGYGPRFGNVTVGNPVTPVNWVIVGVVVVAVVFVVWGRK